MGLRVVPGRVQGLQDQAGAVISQGVGPRTRPTCSASPLLQRVPDHRFSALGGPSRGGELGFLLKGVRRERVAGAEGVPGGLVDIPGGGQAVLLLELRHLRFRGGVAVPPLDVGASSRSAANHVDTGAIPAVLDGHSAADRGDGTHVAQRPPSRGAAGAVDARAAALNAAGRAAGTAVVRVRGCGAAELGGGLLGPPAAGASVGAGSADASGSAAASRGRSP